MSEQKLDSGKMERLVFCRNADDSKEKPENGKLDFTVMINPESISRSLSLAATSNKSAKSKSKGDAFDCEPETISFTFYLDRTNVVPPTQTRHDGQSVGEMIDEFLKVVYKTTSGKPVQSLAIKYGALEWTVRASNLKIDHTLFDRYGNTLRAKVTCSFMTIKDNKPETPKKKSKPSSTSSNSTGGYACPDVCAEARNNNQNSLYTSVDANFSTVDGYEIKV